MKQPRIYNERLALVRAKTKAKHTLRPVRRASMTCWLGSSVLLGISGSGETRTGRAVRDHTFSFFFLKKKKKKKKNKKTSVRRVSAYAWSRFKSQEKTKRERTVNKRSRGYRLWQESNNVAKEQHLGRPIPQPGSNTRVTLVVSREHCSFWLCFEFRVDCCV